MLVVSIFVFSLFILLPAIPTYTLITQVSGRSGAWLFLLTYAADAALVVGVFLLLAGRVQRWLYHRSQHLEDAARRWARNQREEWKP